MPENASQPSSAVLALVPARRGSRECPGKNLRTLGGKTLIWHACYAGLHGGAYPVVISTDYDASVIDEAVPTSFGRIYLRRPPRLATDTTPMIAVVQHALQQIPGPPDDIIVLLQPTQPLRKPAHIQEAVRLLEETSADSVVSVVALPLTHSPEFAVRIISHPFAETPVGSIVPWESDWHELPSRRQAVTRAYIRDGTVYAFRRATVDRYGTIYGQDVRPLIILPEDTCELDTEVDWLEVERRWTARHG